MSHDMTNDPVRQALEAVLNEMDANEGHCGIETYDRARTALASSQVAAPPLQAGQADKSIAKLLDLIEDYWGIAYTEGKEGRTRDNETADASRKWNEIRAEARRLASPTQEAGQEAFCTWHQDGDEGSSTFATQCGHFFQFNEGTPTDNSAKFCLYCGGKLIVSLIEPESDEDAAPPSTRNTA